MSQHSKNNSIVFLTTLSVYLGLVLVGGAMSPVLAQAATTRNFNVQDEIEVKDDLDKKPKNGNCDELNVGTDELNNQFIQKYASEILSLVKKTYISSELAGHEVKLNLTYEAFENDEFFAKLFPNLTNDVENNGFTLTIDKSGLLGKLSLKSKSEKHSISSLIPAYNASLNFSGCKLSNQPENVILKNTTVFYENNQIFIVTRLPRGSLDALFTKDAN